MLKQAVVDKDDDKPKNKEVHFKDGVSSMIMDIKMPPHFNFRKGNNNMYKFNLNSIVRQSSSTELVERLPNNFLTMKIQQKNTSKQNVDYNQIVNLAKFFSSGRDTIDYGYSLDSVGNPMIEEEFNSPSRPDKSDCMNNNCMSTEIPAVAVSTGKNKIPIYTESTEIYKLGTDTENTESSSTTECYDPDVSIHLEFNFH